MKGQQLRDAYVTFFDASDAGQHFLESINKLISNYHEKAENDPAMARDYTQRAKGIRDIADHITVVKVNVSRTSKGANGEKE